MSNDELIGSVSFNLTVPLGLSGDPVAYAIEIDGHIGVSRDEAEDFEPDAIVGHVKLLQVKLAEALVDDVPLFWVLDNQCYEWLYSRLFKEDGVFARNLQIDAPYGDLLIIEEIEPERRFEDTPLRHQVIEACVKMFASVGVVLARQEMLDMTDDDLLRHGYRPLCYRDWLYRDNATGGR